jgi:hypothetical protein
MSDKWRHRAQRVIYDLCIAEYEREKSRLKGKKKRIEYSVPEMAENLIECLNTDDEGRAKSIMLEYNDRKYEDGVKRGVYNENR